MTYDALLIVSFGGPERREDVIPFLENVLRGKRVPRERMLEVAEHYAGLPGRSSTRAGVALPHSLGSNPTSVTTSVNCTPRTAWRISLSCRSVFSPTTGGVRPGHGVGGSVP